ncbi:MAG: outer membrane protein assembly factor BamD [Planctomycetota bacterium]
MRTLRIAWLGVSVLLLVPAGAHAQLRWDAREQAWSGAKKAQVSAEPGSPEAEYLDAVSMMEAGAFRPALRKLEALQAQHPQSLLREKILFRIAECRYHRKDYRGAYDKLRELGFSTEHEFSKQAVELELSIADALLHGGKVKLLGFIRVSGKSTGEKILRDFIDRNPRGPYADDALFLLARFYLDNRRYDDAATNFAFLASTFPRSDYAQESEYLESRSRFLSCRGPQYDTQPLREARDGYRIFLQKYPQSELAEEIQKDLCAVENMLAEKLWLVAEFYRRDRQGPSAAVYYRAIMTEFPQSPRAAQAEKRLTRMPSPPITEEQKEDAGANAQE